MNIGDAVIRLGDGQKGYIEGFPETGKARVAWVEMADLPGEKVKNHTTIATKELMPPSDAAWDEVERRRRVKFERLCRRSGWRPKGGIEPLSRKSP